MSISKYKLSVIPLFYSEAGSRMVFVAALHKGDQDSAAPSKVRKKLTKLLTKATSSR